MKWFKHISSSRRDPDMFAAREKYGGDAIDIFWSTVELIAEEFNGEPVISGSAAFFKQQIPGYSIKKILKIWDAFDGRIIYSIDGDEIIVAIPKLAELSDPYTKQLNRSVTAPPPKPQPTKPISSDNGKQDTIPYDEIISYLNEKAGKKYNSKIESHRKFIRGRWNDGARLDDFKKAIDNKVAEWKGDLKMDQYLRPSTLFCAEKFDGYVNSTPPVKERKLVF